MGRAHLDRARNAKLQWQTFTTEEKVMAVETSEQATLEVLEKATGEPIGTVAAATVQDLDLAVDAAVAAQPGWAATSYDERAVILRRAAAALERRANDVADLIVRETGSIPGKAQYEVGGAANELYEAAGLTSRAVGEILPSHSPGRFSLAERIPVGVVGAITPWNFPLILGMRVTARRSRSETRSCSSRRPRRR
jgi:benzaldehyde dehydrogenase (NAD)